MVPNRVTYTVLISACTKGKQPEQALKIFGDMKQRGLVPNVITYNALISAFSKGRSCEQAPEMLFAIR